MKSNNKTETITAEEYQRLYGRGNKNSEPFKTTIRTPLTFDKIAKEIEESISQQVLNINPIGKPRMTRSDKWKKRPAVVRYHEWKDSLRSELMRLKIDLSNTNVFNFVFIIEMPESWSAKKKAQYVGEAHQVKPDIDNILKAILDTVNKQDQTVFKVSMEKRWGFEGKIIIL